MKKKPVLAVAFAIISLNLIIKAGCDIINSDFGMSQQLFKALLEKGTVFYNPFMAYSDSDWEKRDSSGRIWNKIWKNISILQITEDDFKENLYLCEYLQNKNVTSLEAAVIAENEAVNENINENINESVNEKNKETTVIMENKNMDFVPAEIPRAMYSRQQLREKGFIEETFYSVDPTTMVREGQLDFDKLMSFDASLKQDNSMPQILVYHTHSQEAYIDSVPNDENTSIMGVGECLCNILRTKYGYNVIHHMGKYDVESRDYAYSKAMSDIENVLAQNPTIEVVIDLHRDETAADTKLVTTIQGIDMAKFMFFNGLSYTRELGELTELPNPYVQDNLSFAFQMQLFAEEYYPGLTRRIYLKGYRYNMHYRAKTMLVELGSQTNTVEEAKNSCEPLAHIIHKVLSGTDRQ